MCELSAYVREGRGDACSLTRIIIMAEHYAHVHCMHVSVRAHIVPQETRGHRRRRESARTALAQLQGARGWEAARRSGGVLGSLHDVLSRKQQGAEKLTSVRCRAHTRVVRGIGRARGGRLTGAGSRCLDAE